MSTTADLGAGQQLDEQQSQSQNDIPSEPISPRQLRLDLSGIDEPSLQPTPSLFNASDGGYLGSDMLMSPIGPWAFDPPKPPVAEGPLEPPVMFSNVAFTALRAHRLAKQGSKSEGSGAWLEEGWDDGLRGALQGQGSQGSGAARLELEVSKWEADLDAPPSGAPDMPIRPGGLPRAAGIGRRRVKPARKVHFESLGDSSESDSADSRDSEVTVSVPQDTTQPSLVPSGLVGSRREEESLEVLPRAQASDSSLGVFQESQPVSQIVRDGEDSFGVQPRAHAGVPSWGVSQEEPNVPVLSERELQAKMASMLSQASKLVDKYTACFQVHKASQAKLLADLKSMLEWADGKIGDNRKKDFERS